MYGAGGYFEFTGFPDYKFSDDPTRRAGGAGGARGRRSRGRAAKGRRHDAISRRQAVLHQPHHVHRQHDDARQRHPPRDAAARERRLQHGSAEVQHPAVEPARLLQAARGRARTSPSTRRPASTNKVDVKVKLEEQNRNQMSFGAGVSEFEGFFGQLSFQTSNFLGPWREPHRVAVGRLPRAELHAGLHRAVPLRSEHHRQRQPVPKRGPVRRTVHAESTGGRARVRVPARRGFTRMFTNYSYEHVRVTEVNALYQDPLLLARNPFLRDSLLHRRQRRAHHQQGHAERRAQHGRSADLPDDRASDTRRRSTSPGLGGQHQILQAGGRRDLVLPSERAHVARHARRRASTSTTCATRELPIFEKLFLGGEYSRARVRHPEHRSAGSGDRPRARRQQEPAVQHRAELQHRRASSA